MELLKKEMQDNTAILEQHALHLCLSSKSSVLCLTPNRESEERLLKSLMEHIRPAYYSHNNTIEVVSGSIVPPSLYNFMPSITLDSFYRCSGEGVYIHEDTRIDIGNLSTLFICMAGNVNKELFDTVSRTLQNIKSNDLAFGGVRLIMIATLHDIQNNTSNILKSRAWQLLNPITYSTSMTFAIKESEIIEIDNPTEYSQS